MRGNRLTEDQRYRIIADSAAGRSLRGGLGTGEGVCRAVRVHVGVDEACAFTAHAGCLGQEITLGEITVRRPQGPDPCELGRNAWLARDAPEPGEPVSVDIANRLVPPSVKPGSIGGLDFTRLVNLVPG